MAVPKAMAPPLPISPAALVLDCSRMLALRVIPGSIDAQTPSITPIRLAPGSWPADQFCAALQSAAGLVVGSNRSSAVARLIVVPWVEGGGSDGMMN